MSTDPVYLPGASQHANDQVRVYEATDGVQAWDMRGVPVVILTTSGAAPDIVSSYQHRANAYVTKPFGLDDFEATVRQIDRFYREVAVLPSSE